MNANVISSDYPYISQYVNVLGSKMHYIEQGNGNPILFLHGVPTSSYLWRNIIPHLSGLGRCIAVDLIGFGKSDKPDIDYSITDHIHYIEAFIKALNLKNITLVMHGWGSIIGFDYAMHHENNCKALVFYESYIRPVIQDDLSLPLREQLYFLEDDTLDVVMNASQFVDRIIPQSMTRTLSDIEKIQYREPFLSTGSGKPLLKYLQELPQNNEKTNQRIAAYSSFIQKSTLPKLLLYSVPGFTTTIATIVWAKKHISHLEIIEVGEALHFVQESNPAAMGESISAWLQGLEQLETTRS